MTISDATPLATDFESDTTRPPTEQAVPADAALAERLGERLRAARAEIGRIIHGQRDVIDQTLVSILAGGHGLLVGAPGLGKTLLVTTLGTVLGLEARRVQFTPDLMPSDITGSEILDEDEHGHRSFRFVRGPVFCQLLMADEINRASPRTQSALLQAMQEHRVAIAGTDHALPRPFHVLATQNPIEQEGTYPLPEAQLDRFMLQIPLGFPDAAAERAMLLATTGADDATPRSILTDRDLVEAQRLVRALPVGDSVVDAILHLVRSARPETTDDPTIREAVAWGPGPRAAQALMLATRARALMDGRLSPSIDDVAALARPVLAHRMALTFTARAEGRSLPDLIDSLLRRLG
ncbi:MoxR family transcriptional regulator [Gluconacetobacter johannae DSM 13595]|uniref:MoxR family ATPase n=1 Tax=Gluconacetobacter johannae TaxID=112140 RepID=A0A7W4P6C9_9PROT|nr:MoxR family ATPase [Gluconacetobacter johannae]MBB2177118.1 MoxR family ATPase [Gluconacetobacter johannae]GBQ88443.1 MoxR family transcriptional regulator [Gluconacetobacter johannae DSM 13595]